jgi:hypothetical protein
MKQNSEKITNAWTAFKPDKNTIGMLYQAPSVKPGIARITMATIVPVVKAYHKKFGVMPQAILIHKKDITEELTAAALEYDTFPPIGTANFLSPDYGYIFLQHSKDVSKKQPQGIGD